MARLVTKFKFLKSGDRKGAGGYAKYIATREGVERIDDSQRLAPATKQQETLIEKILKDFPDSATLMEYADYQSEPNMGNASEFIFRAIEDNADDLLSSKTYADYIATRPRAQRFGSHGLFTDDGVRVQLEKVSEELNLHEGNVWTAIISLRREDAERLGFNSGERWRDMLRAHTHELSDAFHIPMTDLKWFAAFHNEGHHPHVHLMIYSANPKEGYQKTPREMAEMLIKEVLTTTGITATAGIGTNMYLAKVAMDITAKKMPADENGVRIAELDEMSYRRELWTHRPLTDFWMVGRGISKKLEDNYMFTMGDVARCSQYNEAKVGTEITEGENELWL